MLDRHLTFSTHLRNKISPTRLRVKALYKLLCWTKLTLRLEIIIFKTVIRPALLYGSPLYKLYISTLVKLQQFENRLLWTIVTGTTSQRNRIRLIRDTLNISTAKSYITQRHIKFYHSMHRMSSPLFSLVRAPTRTFWHHSRIIDITRQDTDHLHRCRLTQHHNSLLMQRL